MEDSHSLVAGQPIVDECTQDWTLLSAEAGNGSLVFEAERALDTGDAQDWVFTDDSQDGEKQASISAERRTCVNVLTGSAGGGVGAHAGVSTAEAVQRAVLCAIVLYERAPDSLAVCAWQRRFLGKDSSNTRTRTHIHARARV